MSQSIASAAGLVQVGHGRVGVSHEVAERCGRIRLPNRARGQQRHCAHRWQQCTHFTCHLQGTARVTCKFSRAFQPMDWNRVGYNEGYSMYRDF